MEVAGVEPASEGLQR